MLTTVTSSDGQIATTTQSVTVWEEPCSRGRGGSRNYTAATRSNDEAKSSKLINSKDSFRVYPNPTKDIFIVEHENQQMIDKIEVIDVKGAIILSKVDLQNNKVEVNLSVLPSGIYYIKIFQKRIINYRKIVK